MSNARAIKDFSDYWRDHDKFEVTPVGNCIFPANVHYDFDGKEVEQNTTVTIIRNGYSDGKVSIEEKGLLSAIIFHLDFSTDFQKYRYKKSDHSFIVEGESPKMHGAYKVTISPL